MEERDRQAEPRCKKGEIRGPGGGDGRPILKGTRAIVEQEESKEAWKDSGSETRGSGGVGLMTAPHVIAIKNAIATSVFACSAQCEFALKWNSTRLSGARKHTRRCDVAVGISLLVSRCTMESQWGVERPRGYSELAAHWVALGRAFDTSQRARPSLLPRELPRQYSRIHIQFSWK